MNKNNMYGLMLKGDFSKVGYFRDNSEFNKELSDLLPSGVYSAGYRCVCCGVYMSNMPETLCSACREEYDLDSAELNDLNLKESLTDEEEAKKIELDKFVDNYASKDKKYLSLAFRTVRPLVGCGKLEIDLDNSKYIREASIQEEEIDDDNMECQYQVMILDDVCIITDCKSLR